MRQTCNGYCFRRILGYMPQQGLYDSYELPPVK